MLAFLAERGELRWKQKYLTAEWREILYQDMELSPVNKGIGTKASQGYRVLERTGVNQVLVML